jgi:hypothetical protein
MSMNYRSISFALVSGTVMMVASTMAFANPDQTNPRESAVSTPTQCVSNCEAVSQDNSAVSAPTASSSASDETQVEQHDARRNRNTAQKAH